MARPTKIGLDYFPLDVDMDQDDKIALIEAEHGLLGFAIVIKLLMKIYKNGYFYQWTKKEQLLFSKKVNVDINQVNVVINSCLEWGFFDKEKFETFEILTSAGIQRRYLEATSRRNQVEIRADYLLLNNNEVNAYKNLVIVGINPNSKEVNDGISTQSKVKKSKVYIQQQQKGTEQESESLTNNDLKKIVDIFNKNIHPITPLEGEILSEWLKKVEANVIIEAIRESVKSGVRNIKYIEKILQSWHSNGLTTKEAVIAHLRDYQDKKNKGKVVPMKIETYDDKEDLYKQYEGLW